MRIYGLKNCDSTRKAVRFFETHGIPFERIDFKERAIGCETIDRWLEKIPIDRLFNARSTTYRTLKLGEKKPGPSEKRAWLCKENRLVKRPVVETDDGEVIVGFDENQYKEKFL
ncbi:arsenate reductase family protein [Hydrogenimonas sp.]